MILNNTSTSNTLKNKLIYKCIFTIYKVDRRHIIDGISEVFMHLVVFQNLLTNYDEYNVDFKFSVINIPTLDKNSDPEVALLSKIFLVLLILYNIA